MGLKDNIKIYQPTQEEWDVADKLVELTKNNLLETVLHKLNKKYLSGYDRHSLGIILASDDKIKNYGFNDKYEEYPSSNSMHNKEGISLDNENIRSYLRTVRTKEGVSLMEMKPQGTYLIRNGIRLPHAEILKVIESYDAGSDKELTDMLGIKEEIGGKTLALLNMSLKYPDVAFLRIDGQKYMIKSGVKYDLQTGPSIMHSENIFMPTREFAQYALTNVK